MNPQNAAEKLLATIKANPIRDPNGVTIEHAYWILKGITLGYIQHEKAHRWLGYAQAILVLTGTATLDEMKLVNAGASDEKG